MKKADFVRKHGGLTPAQVVDAARKAGVELELQHVYATRHYDAAKLIRTGKRPTPALQVKLGGRTMVARDLGPIPVALGLAAMSQFIGRGNAAQIASDRILADYAYQAGRDSSPEQRFGELALELGFDRSRALLTDLRARALELAE